MLGSGIDPPLVGEAAERSQSFPRPEDRAAPQVAAIYLPGRRASLAVKSASLPLPSEYRYRYRQEFLAELYAMTPPSSCTTPPGSCPRVWTLRVALGEPAPLLMHRWQRLRNPEGGWYRECRSCQEQQDPEDMPMVFPSP